jgi:hypothetical protein
MDISDGSRTKRRFFGRWRMTVLFVVVFAVVAAPTTAIAVHLFTDVPHASTHATGISWLSGTGVTSGCSATRYCPDDAVTRGQMATFMHRLSGNAAGVQPMVNAATVQGLAAADLIRANGGEAELFTFSTTTADADPGSGVVRLGSTTLSSVTQAYVDLENSSGTVVTAWLDSLASSTSANKAVVTFRRADSDANYARYYLTGVTSANSYRKLALTHIASAGSLNTTAGNLLITVARIGDKGASASGAYVLAGTLNWNGNSDTYYAWPGITASNTIVTDEDNAFYVPIPFASRAISLRVLLDADAGGNDDEVTITVRKMAAPQGDLADLAGNSNDLTCEIDGGASGALNYSCSDSGSLSFSAGQILLIELDTAADFSGIARKLGFTVTLEPTS